MTDMLVVKIGGSTLGGHDTSLEDIVELQRRGMAPVVVHGGGPLISEWLSRTAVPTRFERGLRVTDEQSLDIVVAVLAGLVNKRLVASIQALGGPAVGLSGVDGGILRCRIADPSLGFVGEITEIDAAPVVRVLLAGGIPVIAPIGLLWEGEAAKPQLLNVNADTVAGAIAAALPAHRLVFLTDVAGVKDGDRRLIPSLKPAEAEDLIRSGVIEGGMIPKVEACLHAASASTAAVIADGTQEHVFLRIAEGEALGTAVGG